MAEKPTELLICVKCRRPESSDEDDIRPGRHLLDRMMEKAALDGIVIKPVECLSNCSRGCTIALRGSEKWSYVYGNLTPEDVATITEGAALYHASADGIVPWRERPEHFRKNCIARIPPLEPSA